MSTFMKAVTDTVRPLANWTEDKMYAFTKTMDPISQWILRQIEQATGEPLPPLLRVAGPHLIGRVTVLLIGGMMRSSGYPLIATAGRIAMIYAVASFIYMCKKMADCTNAYEGPNAAAALAFRGLTNPTARAATRRAEDAARASEDAAKAFTAWWRGWWRGGR